MGYRYFLFLYVSVPTESQKLIKLTLFPTTLRFTFYCLLAALSQFELSQVMSDLPCCHLTFLINHSGTVIT